MNAVAPILDERNIGMCARACYIVSVRHMQVQSYELRGQFTAFIHIIAGNAALSTTNCRANHMKTLRGLIVTMRPRQWTKNILFVFPAIVFNAQLFDSWAFARVVVCSVLMIVTSGCVYFINDLVDINSDRQHPSKRHRPIAAGTISVPLARLAALILGLTVLLAAYSFERQLALLLLVYLVLQISYSLYLKSIVLLDILVVAAGFVLRIVAGGLVIGVALSPWLITSGSLLALFLVIGKRRQELALLGDQAAKTRKIFQRYNLTLLDDMLRVVTTCVMITYIIYTVDSPTMIKNGQNLGLITVPIVIYGLFRYLYLIHVEEEGSAPDEVLLTDRALQATIAAAALAYVVIIYIL